MTNNGKIELGTLSDDNIADEVGKAIHAPVCVEAKKRIIKQASYNKSLLAEIQRLLDEVESSKQTMLDALAMAAVAGTIGSPRERAATSYEIGREMMAQKNISAGKFVMHVIGPDDLFEYPDEITAHRKANQHNTDFAKLMEGDGFVNGGPYCVAVVETGEEVSGKTKSR